MISILEESKKSRRMGFLGKNKKIIIGGLILIIVGYAGYSYFRGNKTQTVQTAPKEWIVKQDDLQIAIEADGKVVAEDGVELSFSVSGDNLEVEDVFVKEGDKVKKGDKIATVKTETLEFNLRNAYSSYQISLEQGKINLENTKQSAENSIYNAEQAVKDAKENLDDNQDELTSESVKDAYKILVDTIKSINISLESILPDLDDIQDAKDALDDYVQDYEDALRDLENAKKNAERDIANSESSLKSKELSLEQAKRDYNDLIAPLTDAELASARSKLTSASINLEKANLELDKATIISPIDGEVAMLNYKKGDIIVDNSSSDPVAVIINNDTLFIEVNIEEADINKISVGQKAYATFDALNDLKFEGEISFISLTSETSNSGIVTYLVRIIITNTGEAKIREGMTAFVDFIIAEANNVLSIPVAAVRNIEGNPSTTLENGEIKKVTTGFTDGKNVEVINGLNAGDKIIY